MKRLIATLFASVALTAAATGKDSQDAWQRSLESAAKTRAEEARVIAAAREKDGPSWLMEPLGGKPRWIWLMLGAITGFAPVVVIVVRPSRGN